MGRYKKYDKADQRSMAAWALDCAQRVLPLFEAASPADDRPRKAIEAGREWVRTGVFSMAVIRKASLDAHAAAKEACEDESACLAAHAAGQAVATAHVAQHAYGGAFYALRAIAAASPKNAWKGIGKELAKQKITLPAHLRQEIMARITVSDDDGKPKISLDKSAGF